jgi:hypothetical protein
VILARDSGFLMTYASTVDLEEAYKVGPWWQRKKALAAPFNLDGAL